MAGTTIPGDPFGSLKDAATKAAPTPQEVKFFHERADTDSSAQAMHHTLGIKHDQASPGDHNHNGQSSRQLMRGITVSGSKGGNAALADLITELAAVLGFTDGTT